RQHGLSALNDLRGVWRGRSANHADWKHLLHYVRRGVAAWSGYGAGSHDGFPYLSAAWDYSLSREQGRAAVSGKDWGFLLCVTPTECGLSVYEARNVDRDFARPTALGKSRAISWRRRCVGYRAYWRRDAADSDQQRVAG